MELSRHDQKIIICGFYVLTRVISLPLNLFCVGFTIDIEEGPIDQLNNNTFIDFPTLCVGNNFFEHQTRLLIISKNKKLRSLLMTNFIHKGRNHLEEYR